MYIVEGNIGAGKSTFLQLIGKHMPHVSIALEPLNDWQNEQYGQSLLKNFYDDTKRWAYTLETLTLMCRVKEHLLEQQLNAPLRVVERSIYSGNYCFAKNGHEHGFLTDIEWHMYSQWFDFLVQKCTQPKGFIYLQVSPDISYERIRKRNRDAEASITLSYIQQIHDKHEQFLHARQNVHPKVASVPVLTLNCDQEFEQNPTKLAEHLERLTAFFENTATQGF